MGAAERISKFLSFVLRHDPGSVGLTLEAGGWVSVERRGKPVVLEVDAAGMSRAGHQFFCSENGVWLTEHVPVRFLRLDLSDR